MLHSSYDLIIPAGYKVIVTSWENDADYYRTEYLQGLSQEELNIVLELIELFRDSKNPDYIGNVSNMTYDNSPEKVTNILNNFYKKHKNSELFKYVDSEYTIENEEDYSEIVFELLYELGLSGNSEYFLTRVVDSITVYYFETNVYAPKILEKNRC